MQKSVIQLLKEGYEMDMIFRFNSKKQLKEKTNSEAFKKATEGKIVVQGVFDNEICVLLKPSLITTSI